MKNYDLGLHLLALSRMPSSIEEAAATLERFAVDVDTKPNTNKSLDPKFGMSVPSQMPAMSGSGWIPPALRWNP